MTKTRRSICNVPDKKSASGEWMRGFLVTTESEYVYHHTKMGMLWTSINNRCKEGGREQSLFPTYTGCENKFQSFNLFGEWCTSQIEFGYGTKDDEDKYYWQLDKDILVPNNKTYSATTCCFVPDYINSLLLTGNKEREGRLPLGVDFHRKSGKFRSRCGGGGRTNQYLGLFTSPIDAHKCWQENKCKQIIDSIARYSNSGKVRQDVISSLLLRVDKLNSDLLSLSETEDLW